MGEALTPVPGSVPAAVSAAPLEAGLVCMEAYGTAVPNEQGPELP